MDLGLIPLEGLDDQELQIVAINRIAAHFSNVDSLATVSNHKQSLIQQKKTIEAQIKNEVNGELDKSKKGLETLHRSFGRIEKMSTSFGSTVQLCKETSSLIGYYPLIKKVNTVRSNLMAILKEVDRLLTIPEKAAEIESLMENDINILVVHKKIRELERLHKNALKQFESNYEELEAIREMFSSVPLLSDRFESKIWNIVSNSIKIAQQAPAVLVKVAQIIEREKLYEEQLLEKLKQTALLASEGIEDDHQNNGGYGDTFIKVLHESIASRFEPLFLTCHKDLVATLKEVNAMVDELNVIMDQVSECYPPSYDMFNFFVKQYHSKFYSLFESFSNLIEIGVKTSSQEPAHILMLIEWVMKEYPIQLGRLGIQDMSPPLLDALDPIINIYKIHIQGLMKDWCDNIITNDNQTRPDVVEGQYSTFAPVHLFESVNTQLDVAHATKCQKLVVGVMEEVINALLYFQTNYVKLLQERNHEIKFENVIASVNNNSRSYDFTQSLQDKVSNILDTEYMSSLDFDPVLDGFLGVARVGTMSLASVIFRDLEDTIKKFYTPLWYTEDLMQPIINTLEDYFTNDIQRYILENYMKRLSLLCLDTLIEYILIQLITGKNQFNENTYQRMSDDCDKILDFFKKYLRLSVATGRVQVIEDFKQIITCDPGMIPIYFRSIINHHKDINDRVIELVLLQRNQNTKHTLKIDQCDHNYTITNYNNINIVIQINTMLSYLNKSSLTLKNLTLVNSIGSSTGLLRTFSASSLNLQQYQQQQQRSGGYRQSYNNNNNFNNYNNNSNYNNNNNGNGRNFRPSFKRNQENNNSQQNEPRNVSFSRKDINSDATSSSSSSFEYIENRPQKQQQSDFSMPTEKIDWSLENMQPIVKDLYKANEKVAQMTPEECSNFLNEHNVTVKSKDSPAPNPVLAFEDMQFAPSITNILKVNYEKPTPIQSIGWPVALSGRDMIGISQTGSGKTISFFLPAIQHILSQPRQTGPYLGPQVLIIAPTRELSVQISHEAQPYLKAARLNSVVMFGGESKSHQIRDLKRCPQVVIGTPGRIIDIMKEGYLNLKRVSFFVLDEADRMLEMGFEDQIRAIFENIRPDRQVLYWTATWPRKVQTLAHEFIVNPVKVQVGSTELTANPNIKQNFIVVDSEKDKVNALVDTLEKIFNERPEAKVIIFTMTKGGADKLAEHIGQIGNARIESIHGDKQQSRRIAIINGFKNNFIDILVATDVASRGLDIRTITDVINFSMPTQIESYVHRIGRTARAGATGESHTIISKSSLNDINLIPDLIELMTGANQEVPPVISALAPKRHYNNNNNNNYNNNRRGNNNRGGYNNNFRNKNSQRNGPVSFKKRAE
ncbi:exocyst complex subunit 3 [Heterostelium album PN500]|uniref:RNA helicase n=1 Tax=Heterostelium pallidum (strain ATCC 26659 / Pp 5 / PN500) TaxID=670386 RepID=D3BF35_HETP5|nr:exocyst complex subunit 3 [Heterostelium album PN500]EFA80516.1 exocyst complex subunit 3 [Heterostelium album PN500]|eukprot:XP_020432636.1 exocyst complex subunit 3 [Heterostelium album PN500]